MISLFLLSVSQYAFPQIIISFQLMSTISHIRRAKPQPKPSHTRLMMALQRQRKSSTEHCSASPLNEQYNARNILFPLMEKSREFPSIFVSHKRNDYSGYKHSSPSKGKNITNQEERGPNHMPTQRKYEINIKNIAKLRKRYSLEPLNIKKHSRENQRMFLSTSKSLQKSFDVHLQDQNSERKYHKELREMVRLMNLNNHSSSEKMFTNGQKIVSSSTGTSQNLSHCQINSSQEDDAKEDSNQASKLSNRVCNYNKPYYVQFKKRVERKLQCKKKTEMPLTTGNTIEEEIDVCGWSTQSFYPKNRCNFFQDSPSEKLRLIKRHI